MIFKGIESLKAIGKWEVNKKIQKFEGTLKQGEKVLGDFRIEIKKISGIVIYFKNEEFKELNNFKVFASKNFNISIEKIKTRRRAKSDPIFKEMISDIKKTENCLIF